MTVNKKLLIAIVCAVLIICTAVGGTLSYLFAKTDEKTNSFEPVFVSCDIEESFDGVTKSNVKVRNTGDVKAYIRATFIVTWVSEDGHVYSSAPVEGENYSLTLGSTKWVKGSDGFYYYVSPVYAGEATEILISSIFPTESAPEGFTLSVHVAATAIQSEPTKAAEDYWGVTVQSDGKIAPK